MMEEQEILELLNSDNADDVRSGAYEAGDAGLLKALPVLVEKLSIPNPGVQEAIDHALRRIGGRPVIFALVPLLRSEDAPVRNISMDVLREVGRNEVGLLSELLNDTDPDIRIFGADILGSAGSALAVPLLAHSLLYDPEVNVRYQAAVSLGNLAYPEAADALNKALHDDEWVCFAVIEALVKVRAESSVGALLMALDKSSDLVAANIVEALGEMGYIKAAPVLIKRLRRSSGPLAGRIVRAIVQLVGAKSLSLLDKEAYSTLLDHMFTALEDEDPYIQDAAISGLATAREEKYFIAVFSLLRDLDPDKDHERMRWMVETLAGMGYYDFLEERLSNGEDKDRLLAVDIISYVNDPRAAAALKRHFWGQPRDVQRACLDVLAAGSGPEDVDFFAGVLEKSHDGNMLRSALFFFGKTGNAALISDKVWPFLFHRYQDVQESALAAVMAVHDPDLRARFISMTQEQDELSREMAYYALRAYIDDSDIIPYLAVGLNDESPAVRRIAVESMGAGVSLSEERLNYLACRLNDEDKDVRLAVIDVLGHCREEEVGSYLLRGLQDPDPWVRARCVESLGRRQDRELLSEMAALLQDGHPMVVLKAMEAMVESGGEAAFKYLLPLMEHPDAEVQAAAEEHIAKIRSGGV